MKILHIGLTECETLGELLATFYNLDEEINKNGCQLMSSKNEAEEKLMHQYGKFSSRIFWYEKSVYEDKTTFILIEAVFD